MKHNNTAFLREIVIAFSLFYFSETTFVISSFLQRTELYKLIQDAMISP